MQTSATNLEIFYLASFGSVSVARQTVTRGSNDVAPFGIEIASGVAYVGIINKNTSTRSVVGCLSFSSSTLTHSNYYSMKESTYRMLSTSIYVVSASAIYADYQDPNNTNHGFIKFRTSGMNFYLRTTASTVGKI